MSGLTSRIWRLTAATAGLWVLCAAPAWYLAGTAGVEGLSYALLLCLIPGVATLLAVRPTDGTGGALTALLVSMGLRMAIVLGGTLALRQIRPDLGPAAFHVWVIIGYLAMLAMETRFALAEIGSERHASGLGQPAA